MTTVCYKYLGYFLGVNPPLAPPNPPLAPPRRGGEVRSQKKRNQEEKKDLREKA
ncbi:hypothetical protein [Okeania sp. SIO1I7]|uniref:hypothetical protein n=1 Tax=Okeania sp. SIO1I7 TaxID=2607772 RepID=UPI0013FBDDFB|nr:hypothetical protein [Okeania sp. SIO1I7]NET27121.1 hypothetical protein [Okeania sp. SIO1I7]